MPTFDASPYLKMHYLVDDFTEPWMEPDTQATLDFISRRARGQRPR
jgi:hypothetical protein